MNQDDLFSAIVGIVIFIAVIYWYYLRSNFKNLLYTKAFEKLQFIASKNYDQIMSGFKIAYSFTPVTKVVYEGKFNNSKVWYLFFEINQSSNNNYVTDHYSGVIFETNSHQDTLQIYDAESDFKPILSFAKKLESVEFNKAFKVFAPQDASAYYELSPSAMQHLLDLKNKAKTAINIQFFGNKVLFFAKDNSYKPNFFGINEILNQRPSEENIKALSNNILFDITEYYNLLKQIEK